MIKEKKFNSKVEFAEWFKKKTKRLTVDVIKLCKEMEQNPASRVSSYQIIKSSSSTAANYRAACRARSGKEFYAKMCIVVEEADENVFWLELINEAEISKNKNEVKRLLEESTEILKISSTARKNAGAKLKN